MLASLTGNAIHDSWRRAPLSALVRSGAASKLLEREDNRILANDAALLCELIRTVMAVDAEPTGGTNAVIDRVYKCARKGSAFDTFLLPRLSQRQRRPSRGANGEGT